MLRQTEVGTLAEVAMAAMAAFVAAEALVALVALAIFARRPPMPSLTTPMGCWFR